MPKALPDVLELERLANDLEASLPRLQDDPASYPKPITVSEDGHASQMHLCAQHGPFVKVCLAGTKLWLGACRECERDTLLDQRAWTLLPERRAELGPRIAKLMQASRDAINVRVEDAIAAYLPELREMYREAISRDYAKQAHEEAEWSLVQDIKAELLAKGE